MSTPPYTPYNTKNGVVFPSLKIDEIRLFRISPEHLCLITLGSWGSRIVPESFRAKYRLQEAGYQVLILKSKEDFEIADIGVTVSPKAIGDGEPRNPYNLYFYLQKNQPHIHDAMITYRNNLEAEVKKKKAAERRAADKIEANAQGITVSELHFRRKCSKVDGNNERVKTRLMGELQRSMDICDKMRKSIEVLTAALEKLENADLHDLHVRWDDKLADYLDDVNLYAPKVSTLKSDKKKNKL
jgi:hypothetical protein